MSPEALGLYIHIPFCETKCGYCNFNTYAQLEPLIPPLIRALCKEIQLWGKQLDSPEVATIFFGGGTPSWIPSDEIARVLDIARKAFQIRPNAEITAEANPSDITSTSLSAWHNAGINRISMGIQSFDDQSLRLLTRRHTAAEAIEAYTMVRNAPFVSSSLDLIFGLPKQTVPQWGETIETAIHLHPPHISMYALTLEEGTPLWAGVQRGEIPEPDPDLAADMYELAERAFATAGYEHYEISNWAKPGHASQHNLTYWRNEPFLGVGPGAHSSLNAERFWNIQSPIEYIKRLSADSRRSNKDDLHVPVIEDRRPIPAGEEVSETLILALRLDAGVNLDTLEHRFGTSALGGYVEVLNHYAAIGLLRRKGRSFRLTSRGRLLSNEVFVRLLAE